MTLEEIQRVHAEFVQRRGWFNKTAMEQLALIASELGELSNELRGESPTEEAATELADVLLRTLSLLSSFGVSVSQVFQYVQADTPPDMLSVSAMQAAADSLKAQSYASLINAGRPLTVVWSMHKFLNDLGHNAPVCVGTAAVVQTCKRWEKSVALFICCIFAVAKAFNFNLEKAVLDKVTKNSGSVANGRLK